MCANGIRNRLDVFGLNVLCSAYFLNILCDTLDYIFCFCIFVPSAIVGRVYVVWVIVSDPHIFLRFCWIFFYGEKCNMYYYTVFICVPTVLLVLMPEPQCNGGVTLSMTKIEQNKKTSVASGYNMDN